MPEGSEAHAQAPFLEKEKELFLLTYNFQTGRHERDPVHFSRKDYASEYAALVRVDWLSDLGNLWWPFRNAVLTAFQNSASPMKDIQTAYTQFRSAVLAYVEQGVEIGMAEYLQSDEALDSPVPLVMSAADNPEKKRVSTRPALTTAQSTHPPAPARSTIPTTAAEEAAVDMLLSDLALDLTARNALRGL